MNSSHDRPLVPRKAKTRLGKPCKKGHDGTRYVKGSSCVECLKEKAVTKSILRAGRTKCRRCRKTFIRLKGEIFRICERCREHCARCDVLLTEQNKDQTAKTRNQYICKSCVAEIVRNTVNKVNRRDYELQIHYGITINEYEAILASQLGVCYICGRPPKNVALSVDHKHEPGEKRRDPRERRARVRGILCWHCNNALAKFDDSPDFLRKAADYLESCPAQKILTGYDKMWLTN